MSKVSVSLRKRAILNMHKENQTKISFDDIRKVMYSPEESEFAAELDTDANELILK